MKMGKRLLDNRPFMISMEEWENHVYDCPQCLKIGCAAILSFAAGTLPTDEDDVVECLQDALCVGGRHQLANLLGLLGRIV